MEPLKDNIMDVVDRIFWGVMGFIGMHFVLLGGLENIIPFYMGSALAFVYLIWFVFRGYRYFGK